MSDHEENHSYLGFDSADHQPAYIYGSGNNNDDAPVEPRPAKRRKVANGKLSLSEPIKEHTSLRFEPLLKGLESEECVRARQEIYERSWSKTDQRIQSILEEANEDTLAEVSKFVNHSERSQDDSRVPSAFIVTGPNISSQGLLFKQLSTRLKVEVDGPVAVLKSADATTLKAVLKHLIRATTNHLPDAEELSNEQDGRKLLYYDLEILRRYIQIHRSEKVVIAIQDSEAFETNILAELIALFNSWMDRIPFVLLFGIATSVELFQERLPKMASRCLVGIQVDVEQTSAIIERIFQTAVANSGAVLRLAPELLSTLIERQQDHLQSVQSFVAAIKYAYMCHFYGNALSVLSDTDEGENFMQLLQPYHYYAIRTLPSFRPLVESPRTSQGASRARQLLEDDDALSEEIKLALNSRLQNILKFLRALYVFQSASTEVVDSIQLYMIIFVGDLGGSNFLKGVLGSLKKMTPDDMITFVRKISTAIREGSFEMDLRGWADEDEPFLRELQNIDAKAVKLAAAAEESGVPIRSSTSIHSTTMRATVIAQRVQMAWAESTLSRDEKQFLELVERLSALLQKYFTLPNPRTLFLNELWLCNPTTTLLEVFAPRPRAAMERALSFPQAFLTSLTNTNSTSSHPATAILYQRYLEAGSLINMADLWSSFIEVLVSDEEEEYDEREGLMLFYRALADLKLMGAVKQSRKKVDHLGKVSWMGL